MFREKLADHAVDVAGQRRAGIFPLLKIRAGHTRRRRGQRVEAMLVKEAVRSLNWLSGSHGEKYIQQLFANCAMCDIRALSRDVSPMSENGHETADVALESSCEALYLRRT